MVSTTIALGLSVYLQRFHRFGLPGPFDFGIVRSGARKSLSQNYVNFFSYPDLDFAVNAIYLLKTGVFILALLIPLMRIVVRLRSVAAARQRIVVLYLATVFLLAIWFAPFAAQHPMGSGLYGSTENLRLVAQPAISLVILSLV